MARGQIVNRAGLAEFFGIALPTVDGWIRQGVPVVQRGGPGRQWEFDTAAVYAWRVEKVVTEATGDVQTDEMELRRRKLQAETNMAELELAKARAEVAPVKEFERAQAAAFAQIRANVMNVPQRIVVQLLGETNESVFKSKLKAELSLALHEAANAQLLIGDEEALDDE